MNKIVLCLIMMAVVCWVGFFVTDHRPIMENMVPFVSGFILLLGAIVLELFVGYQTNIKELNEELQRCIEENELQHERQWVYEPKEEDDLIDWGMDLDFSKEIREMEDFLIGDVDATDAVDHHKNTLKKQMFWIKSDRFDKRSKKRCGDRYKDHHRKDGVRRKEKFACWNM